jgi:hypothetical protein
VIGRRNRDPKFASWNCLLLLKALEPARGSAKKADRAAYRFAESA